MFSTYSLFESYPDSRHNIYQNHSRYSAKGSITEVIKSLKQAVREARPSICPAPCKLPVGGRPAVASLG